MLHARLLLRGRSFVPKSFSRENNNFLSLGGIVPVHGNMRFVSTARATRLSYCTVYDGISAQIAVVEVRKRRGRHHYWDQRSNADRFAFVSGNLQFSDNCLRQDPTMPRRVMMLGIYVYLLSSQINAHGPTKELRYTPEYLAFCSFLLQISKSFPPCAHFFVAIHTPIYRL